MDEDEEVVLKNSGLYTCLIEAGFHDFEIIEKTDLKHSSSENVENLIPAPINDDYLNWQEYENYVQSCLRSKLVFADDASVVENYTASLCTPPTYSLLFSTLKIISYSAPGGILFSACHFFRINIRPTIFWSLQVIPFMIHGARFSFRTYKKYRRKKIISRLLSSLKELSLFAQKSVQFVLNRSVLAFISDQSTNHEDDAYFQDVVFSTLKSTILELKTIIVTLVKDYPLVESVESHQYYLAYLPDEDLHCVHSEGSISGQYLQKMKYAYFLLQSEFLRRFCMCLVPTLRQTTCSETSISQLFEQVSSTSDTCSRLCQRLKSIFEMHYVLEKRSDETRTRQTNINWAYREAYVKLCSLSFNLQSVLRKSRQLERLLEEKCLQDSDHDRILPLLDVGVQHIDSEYAKCQSALDDFRKYVMSLRPKCDHELPAKASYQLVPEEITKTNVLVGTSDFRPQWPDEVFVGVSSDENVSQAEPNDVSTESVSNPCAKLLINELKMALRDKAEEWKKREREALKLKNIVIEETSDDEKEPPAIKLPTSQSCHQKRAPPVVVVAPVQQELKSVPESSLAKQIAAASACWQMREEEHFSFGDDDDDADTDDCDD